MKLKFLWMILLIAIASSNGFTQPVVQGQRSFGGSNVDGSARLFVTKNGDVIVGGSSYSNKSGEKTQNIRGANDYWVIKMNNHGKIQWDKTFGGNAGEYFKSVIQTADGGYALIGESSSYISVEKDEDSRGNSDYWLVKLDKKGDVEWNKTIGSFGNEFVDNIVQTSDGGYIMAGSSDSYTYAEKSEDSRGYFDYWVVKVDKNGNKLWDKTIGGSGYEFCSGVLLTNDGGVILSGFSESNISGEKTENSRGGYDYWVVKLDAGGNIQWDKTIGGNDGDFGRGIQQSDDGGYVISGASYSNASGEKSENGRGLADYWVVQLDKNGSFIKDKTIGGSGDDNEVWCLEKTSDGGYIFGGNSFSDISGEKTENSRGYYDYWVIKLDRSLNIQWDKTLGGFNYEVMFSVKEDGKNRYVVAGESWSDISGDKTEPSRGYGDYWLVWLSDKGEQVDNKILTSVSKPAISPLKKEKIFAVYPNPVRDLINVHTEAKATVTLTDQSGKIMLTKVIDGNGVIKVSSFSPGVYYLKSDHTTAVQKVIVTK